jgi:hypothetical protein
MRLITTLASGERHEREVRDNEEYSTLLKEHFGISAI